jgi:hypothetical protein
MGLIIVVSLLIGLSVLAFVIYKVSSSSSSNDKNLYGPGGRPPPYGPYGPGGKPVPRPRPYGPGGEPPLPPYGPVPHPPQPQPQPNPNPPTPVQCFDDNSTGTCTKLWAGYPTNNYDDTDLVPCMQYIFNSANPKPTSDQLGGLCSALQDDYSNGSTDPDCGSQYQALWASGRCSGYQPTNGGGGGGGFDCSTIDCNSQTANAQQCYTTYLSNNNNYANTVTPRQSCIDDCTGDSWPGIKPCGRLCTAACSILPAQNSKTKSSRQRNNFLA